jgi:MoaA/NifB/PqqE/SkfB family radical SAM enzyme
MSYAHEKMYVAVSTLAGPGTQRERLADAYISSVIRLLDKDIPEELRERFQILKEKITCEEAKGDEGTVKATVNAIEDNEVNEMAEEIVSLYDNITRYEKPRE